MSQSVWFLALFLFLFSRSALSETVNETSCSTIIQDVFPCLDFVDGSSKYPSTACCYGVKGISDSVNDKGDRKAICECLKNTLSSLGTAYDPNLVSQLPAMCGVPITIPPIKGDTDCTE
ncbi:hypothetical protein HS088_TW17G01063 [Tripterygium wilfordii]|uniref:Non-specific lipid-transfer protein n=2 Tax=Tripterygium wilfordii TaxID=458696 RepID=A0A7J7CHM0_TRIWF|nr:hypothetical protein HS088_TW17G01063 [Tripterygium wilfordii]